MDPAALSRLVHREPALQAFTELVGNKVRVTLSSKEGPLTLMVRILWTCAVGDDLFENGGNFLESPTE